MAIRMMWLNSHQSVSIPKGYEEDRWQECCFQPRLSLQCLPCAAELPGKRGAGQQPNTERGPQLSVPLGCVQRPHTSAQCFHADTARHRDGSPCIFTETLAKPLIGLHTLLVALSSLPNRRSQPSCHTLTFQWGMETEKP